MKPRKLLVAAVGVATVTYVAGLACGDTKMGPTSGNMPAPTTSPPTPTPPFPPGVPPTSANLPAPPPPDDAGLDAADASDAPEDG